MKSHVFPALVAIALSAGLAATDAAAQGRAPGPFSAFAPDCEIAAVDKEHLFLAAGVYQGDTLTNILLGPEGLTTTSELRSGKAKSPLRCCCRRKLPSSGTSKLPVTGSGA